LFLTREPLDPITTDTYTNTGATKEDENSIYTTDMEQINVRAAAHF
jgi:hypothetical protein